MEYQCHPNLTFVRAMIWFKHSYAVGYSIKEKKRGKIDYQRSHQVKAHRAFESA